MLEAVDDPRALSFDECERRVRRELADKGLELGSREHQETLELRPRHPAVKPVFDALLKSHDQFAVSPVELLLALISADPALAEQLARHGMTSAALEKEVTD
jgi:hypothetical protein